MYEQPDAFTRYLSIEYKHVVQLMEIKAERNWSSTTRSPNTSRTRRSTLWPDPERRRTSSRMGILRASLVGRSWASPSARRSHSSDLSRVSASSTSGVSTEGSCGSRGMALRCWSSIERLCRSQPAEGGHRLPSREQAMGITVSRVIFIGLPPRTQPDPLCRQRQWTVRLRPPSFQYVHPVRRCSRAVYYRPRAFRDPLRPLPGLTHFAVGLAVDLPDRIPHMSKAPECVCFVFGG
jgi:hypothetical protein